MRDFYKIIRVEANPSTAYHPQTDGLTERYNQEMKSYLRLYVGYHQNVYDAILAVIRQLPPTTKRVNFLLMGRPNLDRTSVFNAFRTHLNSLPAFQMGQAFQGILNLQRFRMILLYDRDPLWCDLEPAMDVFSDRMAEGMGRVDDMRGRSLTQSFFGRF